jgi:phosphohistidine phosphatase SixA
MITVFLVRHADIDRSIASGSNDPPLNSAGRKRAEALAHAIGQTGITAIFTSRLLRTKQTVRPLAEKLHLQPRETASPEVFAREVSSGAAGPTVLVAGHSNTVPQMIAAFGASPPTVHEREFDNLFVVTIAGPGEAALMQLRYGHPSA